MSRRFMRISEVSERTSLSASSIYRLIAANEFPMPVKIGTASRWLEHEIDAYIGKAASVDGTDAQPVFEVSPLLTAEQICAVSREYAICGVYFLIKNKEVIYVGQSRSILRRLAAHRIDKNFDSFHYVTCQRNELSELEQRYIRALRPLLNRMGMEFYNREQAADCISE